MPPLILAIIASAGLGAVVGLIRQWSAQAKTDTESGFSGVRTFTFWSVLGCVAAFLSDEFSPALLPIVVIAVAGHFCVHAWRDDSGATGTTSFSATLLTLLVGALVHWKHAEAAVLVCALTVVILGIKHPLHEWTRKFTDTDIRATLQFVAITGVILPLAPDEDIGPFNGFNPHSTWLMVVLISGVGFMGYVMMRLFDSRAGIALSSFFGGIASSTATTLTFARRSREQGAHAGDHVMAIAIACTVMLPRVIVILAFVSRQLAVNLAWPFALMAAPGVILAALMWWSGRGKRRKRSTLEVGNPLNLATALKFAALYAAISFVVKAAQHTGHLEGSVLPLSFLSGTTDMEAISLSLARNLAGESGSTALATKAIILAAIANSATKGVLAVFVASKPVRLKVAILMAATIACGAAGMAMVGTGDRAGESDAPPVSAPSVE